MNVEGTIRALHQRADTVRTDQLQRYATVLSSSVASRAVAEILTRNIVATILREPTVRLTALAETDESARYAEVLRELFGLDR